MQLHVAVAQLIGEILDDLLVDEVEHRGFRIDQRDLRIQRTEDGRIFDTDDTGADHGHGARQLLDFQQFVAIENGLAVEGNIIRPERFRADGQQDAGRGHLDDLAIFLQDLHRPRIDEACLAANMLDAVAGKLVFQHLDLVIKGDEQAPAQVLRADLFLHPVSAAIKTALAPAGEVECGFAQGFRWDRAGMHRNAADTLSLLDDKNLLAQLGGLDGGPAPCRSTADNHEIILVHDAFPMMEENHCALRQMSPASVYIVKSYSLIKPLEQAPGVAMLILPKGIILSRSNVLVG